MLGSDVPSRRFSMGRILITTLVLLFGLASSALSHSGGTDANGCHRETATGGFHCH